MVSAGDIYYQMMINRLQKMKNRLELKYKIYKSIVYEDQIKALNFAILELKKVKGWK